MSVKWAVKFTDIDGKRVYVKTFLGGDKQRWTVDSRKKALEEVLSRSDEQDARLVKITRKPKPKVARREVWTGQISRAGGSIYQARVGGVCVDHKLLALDNGTPVRVTLEVLTDDSKCGVDHVCRGAS